MQRRSTRVIRSLAILVAISAPLGACGDDAPAGSSPDAPVARPDTPVPPPSASVKLTDRGSFGKILTDGDGRTLYYFGRDFAGAGTTAATSSCAGACVTAWPAFHAANHVVGDGLAASDFAEITRADGAAQTTYKGWPLYTYVSDTAVDDATGDDSGHLWFVVREPFYAMLVMGAPGGAGPAHYLADASGRTLYMLSTDTVGSGTTPPATTCTGTCATSWPPFSADGDVVPTGVDALTTFTRADGTAQRAWRGHLLYRFHGDLASGDTKGNGLNGMWSVVDPTVAP
jgi:predicted lipoprotein with Yx(FWY)xxD motif